MKNKKLLVLGLSSVLLLAGCDSVTSQASSSNPSSNVTTSETTSNDAASSTSSVETPSSEKNSDTTSSVATSSSDKTSDTTTSETDNHREVAMKAMAAKSKESVDEATKLLKTAAMIGFKQASSYEGALTLSYAADVKRELKGVAEESLIVNIDTTGFDTFLGDTMDPNAILSVVENNNSSAYADLSAKISSKADDQDFTLYSIDAEAKVSPKNSMVSTSLSLESMGKKTNNVEAYELTYEQVCGAYAIMANFKTQLAKEGATIVSAVTDVIKSLVGPDDLETVMPTELTMIKELATSIVELISSYASGEKTSEELVNEIANVLLEASDGELDLTKEDLASIRKLVVDVIDYVATINFEEFFDVSFAENTFSFEIKYANIIRSLNGLLTHLITKITLQNSQDPYLIQALSLLTTASGFVALYAPKDLTFKYAVTFNELLDIKTTVDLTVEGALPADSNESPKAYDVALKGTNEFKLVDELIEIKADLPQNGEVVPVA